MTRRRSPAREGDGFLSRVRGLVLERLGRRHAVLLTPDGEFVRVRLSGDEGVSPGQEVWGELDTRAWETLRRAFGGWQRAAAATALAFGAAGALFAAVYLRGWSPWAAGTAPPANPMVGEAVADAQVAPAQAVGAPRPASPPPIRIAERREAPRLSVSVEWRRWSALSLHQPDPRQGADGLDLVEHLRRALVSGDVAGDETQGQPEGQAIPPGSGPGQEPASAGSGLQAPRAGTEGQASTTAPQGPAARPREGSGAARAAAVAVGVGDTGVERSPVDAPKATRVDGVPILRLRAEF